MPLTEEMSPGQRVIGRYVLHEEIASGGMATVHFGTLRAQVGFSRIVAIKRLHAQFAKEPEFVSMFIDEARLAARVQHPNVVPMLNVVALEGELFLVMEYVQGESLSRLLRAARAQGERIPVGIVTSIVAGVLDGLHAAHEARSQRGEPLGIVHRDVSPQNVIVGVDGAARVLDFGVAKAAGRLQTTRDGQLKGKLAYMAPEQLRGEAIDRRTDIYAASVVLWEALTGQRLFAADNQAALFGVVLAGASGPPSQYVPSLPAELDTVVMRGLAVDPAQRYPTAREMALALEQAIGPGSPREVGHWVEQFAGQSLARRAERLAEIENISEIRPSMDPEQPSVPPPPPALPPTTPEVNRASLATPAQGANMEPGEASERSLTSLSTAQSILPRFRTGVRPRHLGALALLAALGIAGVVVVAWLLRPSRPASPITVSSASVLAAGAAKPEPGPEPTTPPDSTASAPQASASAPAATSVTPPPVQHVPRRHHWSRKVAKPSSNCSPPYTLDSHGVRIPKPQCL